ncbi:3-beta-glucosidase) (Laminarinase) (SacteLam55A) [Durusdinium trenchii]|uniref:3-beta-glucosidase (Laminarinase (SacteLam55A n=1 Tax=Durusdinium trenchii TaxID=1381693 RepID=A0ABP0SK56_9DINO
MGLLGRSWALLVGLVGVRAEWYDGIPSVQVFGPEQQEEAESFFRDHYQKYRQAEFSAARQAVLLKRGDYNFSFEVPFYTSVAGVGLGPNEVTVRSFRVPSRLPWQQGGATKTFWRSVEGLNAKETCLWATSQACPLRRSIIHGDLQLSGFHEDEKTLGPSSGGFMADVDVKGTVLLGTQQQFLFRNSEFGHVNLKKNTNAYNTVYVGVKGTPETHEINAPQMVSSIPKTERVAEKPFLVEEMGHWFVSVPNLKLDSVGSRQSAFAPRISIEEMYVARAGDTASSINVGIQGKKGLLLTPGLYEVGEPIMVTDPGFVILGLGFPTLVSKGALPAIMQMADDARVAGILLEGGAEVDEIPRTDALLLWSGHGGVASDIFARVGSFKYENTFHKPCTAKRANIFFEVEGDDVVVDHTWLWHADHDDCTSRWPDSLSAVSCQSQNALLVRGKRVIIYGLQAEHTLEDQVVWYGEEGKVFFYQNELPYIDPYFRLPGSNFGTRFVSYRVAENVQAHSAIGLGSYIISIQGHSYVKDVTAFAVPETTELHNAFIWHITSKNRTPYFKNFLCTASHCLPCSRSRCGDYSKESNMGFVWGFSQLNYV